MLNIANNKGNANQNHNEPLPHTSRGYHPKINKNHKWHMLVKMWGKGNLYTAVDGNVNLCNICGKQYGYTVSQKN